tara:strand:- start:4698 stop:5009 length:312 start_codon:yes stop_codon:yes gene_type:complete
MDLTDEYIKKIITSYENKRNREKKYYHEKKKDDESFKLKNRERAKEHYNKNKDNRKEKYLKDQEIMKIKSLIRYYKSKDRLEEFKSKYPEKVEKIGSNHVLLN